MHFSNKCLVVQMDYTQFPDFGKAKIPLHILQNFLAFTELSCFFLAKQLTNVFNLAVLK